MLPHDGEIKFIISYISVIVQLMQNFSSRSLACVCMCVSTDVWILELGCEKRRRRRGADDGRSTHPRILHHSIRAPIFTWWQRDLYILYYCIVFYFFKLPNMFRFLYKRELACWTIPSKSMDLSSFLNWHCTCVHLYHCRVYIHCIHICCFLGQL